MKDKRSSCKCHQDRVENLRMINERMKRQLEATARANEEMAGIILAREKEIMRLKECIVKLTLERTEGH